MNIPGYRVPLGIAEFKCPYTAQSQKPAEATASNSKFSCSLSSSGELKLKQGHNYYYQVQGTLGITKRSWCDFVIWAPRGTMVDRRKSTLLGETQTQAGRILQESSPSGVSPSTISKGSNDQRAIHLDLVDFRLQYM